MIQSNTISTNTAQYGGGIAFALSDVNNNIIVNNHATFDGGGLFACSGNVFANIDISGNHADRDGGGLSLCTGNIEHNLIHDNLATGNGAGIHTCTPSSGLAIHGNRIYNNTASASGGGLYACGGLIANNIIDHNNAVHGAGLSSCVAKIYDNTVWGNIASSTGGGMDNCIGTTTNPTLISGNIVWSNTAPTGKQLRHCAAPTYCDIQGWLSVGGSKHNIKGPPKLADPDNASLAAQDFRLNSDSPCIDHGDSSLGITDAYYGATRPVDLPDDQHPNGTGGSADIGADERETP
jgi:hypothetical protein